MGDPATVFNVVAFGIFLPGFVVFLFWILLRQVNKARARVAQIKAYAAKYGFGYIEASPERTKYFRSGPFGVPAANVSSVVFGTMHGTAFESFEYHFVTGGDDSRNVLYHVVWIPLPGPVPTMRLDDDGKVLGMQAVGARDLDTESHAFNERWMVWCEDERLGHAVLTPTMIELLLHPVFNGRGLVFERNALMTCVERTTDLNELPTLVAMLARVRDTIPAFVYKAVGDKDEGF